MKSPTLRRHPGNPLIEPRLGNFWEAGGTFNPAAFALGDKVFLLYRQISRNCVSTLGLAVLSKGREVVERLDEPAYIPREPFEVHPSVAGEHADLRDLGELDYLKKSVANSSGGSCFGVEDPRLSLVGSTIYLTYVAYNGVDPPRGAISWISLSDFLNNRWDRWSRPILVTHPHQTDKSIVMLPKKVRGRWVFFHRIFPHIWIDEVEDLSEFARGRYLWGRPAIKTRPKFWDSRKIGAGAVVEFESTWLLVYYGVSGWDDYYYSEGLQPSDFTYVSDGYRYKIGLMLLDLEDPARVLYRPDVPIVEPETWYEMYPESKPGVMYPTGAVVMGEELLIYYGASDYFVALGELNVGEVREALHGRVVEPPESKNVYP
ncbi:MAG: hypothetical protein QXU78_04760 [Sulfolobales archaeon]